MRQIQMLVHFVAKFIFNKDYTEYVVSNEEHKNDTDKLYAQLEELLATKNICSAEDALYDGFDGTENYLHLAMWFYNELNTLSDEELEQSNFSRDEISDGLLNMLKQFEISLPWLA
jgi:predicted ATP-binding protein involved in virulence